MEKRSELDTTRFRDRLIALHRLREEGKATNRRPRQIRLTSTERAEILSKTGGKCHICGGNITGSWHADHVLAHSAGGRHSTNNYLPAHGTCNNYRWDYFADEFRLILKLGVWARTQVELGTAIGQAIERNFSKYEARRIVRRKNTTTNDDV